MSSDQEVILNLWYVRDEEGIIYSLRARACRVIRVRLKY